MITEENTKKIISELKHWEKYYDEAYAKNLKTNRELAFYYKGWSMGYKSVIEDVLKKYINLPQSTVHGKKTVARKSTTRKPTRK